jgi:hypothetical protein
MWDLVEEKQFSKTPLGCLRREGTGTRLYLSRDRTRVKKVYRFPYTHDRHDGEVVLSIEDVVNQRWMRSKERVYQDIYDILIDQDVITPAKER